MANGRTRAPKGGLVLDQCFNDGVRDARREGVNKNRRKEQESQRKVGALVNSEKEGYRKIDSPWFRVGRGLRTQLCLPWALSEIRNMGLVLIDID